MHRLACEIIRLARHSLAALAAVTLAVSSSFAEPSPEAKSVPFEIVVEGPPGPYPYGHAEIRVTVYEGALADAPPELMNLATASEMRPALTLPTKMTVQIPAERLNSSVKPNVSVVISIGRRPGYVSDIATPLERNGVTHVAVKAVD